MDRSWLGWAEIEPSGEVYAGSTVSLKLIYHVGRFGIDDGGSIRVARRSVSDSEPHQFDDPNSLGYTTVTTTGAVRLRVKWDPRGHLRPWRGALQVDVHDGSLAEGDTITVTMGDRRGGAPGFRLQTFREAEHVFKVLVDCFGTGRFEEIEESPRVRIVGGAAEQIQIAAPSEAVIGEPFHIIVRALDGWGNRSDGYRGDVSLSSTDPDSELPACHAFTEEDRGARRLEGVVLNSEGLHTISARDDEGREAVSNPIVVTRERTELRLYWGDFHGQTKQTVGTGTLDEYFTFARDVAGVDFAAWQGNDFQVTRELWERVKEKTKGYHDPGRFVTFLGYEWSGLTPAGGDHNVYFLGDDEQIHRSNQWLIEDRYDEETDRYPISKLWRTFRGRRDVLAVAHVGGRHANLDYFDPERIPLIEVHSHHGTFEWFLEEALGRGLRVGFVANSDDHTCRPGLTYPSGGFTTKGGYTGVYAKELTREALWEAFWSRRCYATTGDRVILRVKVDGHLMGEEFNGYKPPEIKVSVIGTAPLHEVEVKRGVETIHRHSFAKPEEGGKRLIKVEWSGVRVRSRPKRVDWEGSLSLDRGRIASFSEFAFDYPDQGVKRITDRRLEWSSTTGGDPDGVILELDAPEDTEITFDTRPVTLTFKLGDIEYEPLVVDAGGVNQKVKVSAISGGKLPKSLEFNYVDDDPKPGVNPYWVRVVQSDGTMAWSSPVYHDFTG
ncbi:MAG: DUF3604 domain-containing protein [Candidatus Bathyarchaeota archaeon]|nr:MAG: DUF3604 domain-containing protein [Candidatus Bathyarchaeota archaeon]